MAGRNGQGPTLQRLPDACLIAIFSALSPLERRALVPLVCKRWRQLFRNSPPLWQQARSQRGVAQALDNARPSCCLPTHRRRRRRRLTVRCLLPPPHVLQAHLALPADFVTSVDMAALFAWFVARSGSGGGGGEADGGGTDGGNGKEGSQEGGCIRSLHVDVSSAGAWGPTLGVLGVVGRGLRHLRIAGDSPQCQMVGCSAPWLALCPNLVSLELDDVVDQSIGDCTAFPTGAAVVSQQHQRQQVVVPCAVLGVWVRLRDAWVMSAAALLAVFGWWWHPRRVSSCCRACTAAALPAVLSCLLLSSVNCSCFGARDFAALPVLPRARPAAVFLPANRLCCWCSFLQGLTCCCITSASPCAAVAPSCSHVCCFCSILQGSPGWSSATAAVTLDSCCMLSCQPMCCCCSWFLQASRGWSSAIAGRRGCTASPPTSREGGSVGWLAMAAFQLSAC